MNDLVDEKSFLKKDTKIFKLNEYQTTLKSTRKENRICGQPSQLSCEEKNLLFNTKFKFQKYEKNLKER